MATLQTRTLPPELDAQATLERVRGAVSRYTGLRSDERDDHIRQIVATVLEARVRGTLVSRERFRL